MMEMAYWPNVMWLRVYGNFLGKGIQSNGTVSMVAERSPLLVTLHSRLLPLLAIFAPDVLAMFGTGVPAMFGRHMFSRAWQTCWPCLAQEATAAH